MSSVPKREAAVVLLSGGMDSTVCAALSARDFEPNFLHFSYGQRTQARELQAFTSVCDHFQPARTLVVDAPFFRQIGGSALTDENIAVPDPASDAEIGAGPIPVTYVPFRNAHFLAAAISWAEVIGATRVVIGAVAQDGSGYPDCRPGYYRAFQHVVEVGTRDGNIRLDAPLLGLDKAAIVRLGLELGAPFPLSWSCYRNSALACGRCDSCRLRLRAFQQAGAVDPISYERGIHGV